jgi:hypothetical protein
MYVLQIGCEGTLIILCQSKTNVILNHAVSAVSEVERQMLLSTCHEGFKGRVEV